jgi:hypothetical protein
MKSIAGGGLAVAIAYIGMHWQDLYGLVVNGTAIADQAVENNLFYGLSAVIGGVLALIGYRPPKPGGKE